jgi:hypothetical protein
MAYRTVLGMALALAGPGAWAADAAPPATAPVQTQPPAVMVEAADEAQLKERVLARWQALIKRDFEAAYSFETPAYRAVYTVRQFLGQQGGQVDWRMATVKEIRYDDPVVARVVVEIAYRYAEPGEGSQALSLTQDVKETWLRKDGQWWRQRD